MPKYMMMVHRNILIGVGLVAVLGLGGVSAWYRFDKQSAETPATTVDLGSGYVVDLPPGATVEEVPITGAQVGTLIAVPSLQKALMFSSTIDPAVADILRVKEETTIAALKADPSKLDLWIQLGVQRKMAGDYAGAAEVWTYVTKVSPDNYIAYYNLGDLYMNFLTNTTLAEKNLLRVIVLKPEYVDAYVSLYLLYQNKGDTVSATKILEKGLTNNPGNAMLLSLQKGK